MICDCQQEPNGVLQLVYQGLGTVVDTRKGAGVDAPYLWHIYCHLASPYILRYYVVASQL